MTRPVQSKMEVGNQTTIDYQELQDVVLNDIGVLDEIIVDKSFAYHFCKLQHKYPTYRELLRYLNGEIPFSKIRGRWEEIYETANEIIARFWGTKELEACIVDNTNTSNPSYDIEKLYELIGEDYQIATSTMI